MQTRTFCGNRDHETSSRRLEKWEEMGRSRPTEQQKDASETEGGGLKTVIRLDQRVISSNTGVPIGEVGTKQFD